MLKKNRIGIYNDVIRSNVEQSNNSYFGYYVPNQIIDKNWVSFNEYEYMSTELPIWIWSVLC